MKISLDQNGNVIRYGIDGDFEAPDFIHSGNFSFYTKVGDDYVLNELAFEVEEIELP